MPNDSPVWCDNRTKLCERTSCRHWPRPAVLASWVGHARWHEVHPLKAKPHPWVDDRIECTCRFVRVSRADVRYDQLKNLCTAIERPQLISQAVLDHFMAISWPMSC